MMNTVADAVVSILKESGFDACREYPETPFLQKKGARIVVGVEKADCCSPGMGDYLGVKKAAGGSAESDVYGKRLEIGLALEIFAPFEGAAGARLCSETADRIFKLASEFPPGIKPKEMEIREIAEDEELCAFRCICRLKCTAYFVAEVQEDESVFSDFILKGNINCEQ